MTTQDLEILRNRLPKKTLVALHEKTGKSKTYIWQVLNGKRNNDEIIDAAILLANEQKAKDEARKNEITNL